MDNLIVRAKTRDPEALTEIYQRYHAGIYRSIYQRVQDVELAEDIAAEVFVRMLEGIHRFEDRGWPISAWLYRIAHDRSIDMLRRQSKRVTIPIEPWHSVADGPEATVIRVMEHDELRRLLGGLTSDQRRVVELRFWGELDIQTTAARLGRTEGAIKALQHRAVGALKGLIAA
ncbi:MAG: RNA polymerase sigma factor [Chloroflexota bacterium]|nr:RNA polymerase sigma factor [Chloroflexota bacterium]